MTAQDLIDEVLRLDTAKTISGVNDPRSRANEKLIEATPKLARMLKVAMDEITRLTFQHDAAALKRTCEVRAELDRIGGGNEAN